MKTQTRFFLLIALFLSISLSSCTEKLGYIQGEIKDSQTGELLENVTVSISPGNMDNKTTQSDGKFNFSDLTPGLYTLTLTKDDYETTSKDFMVNEDEMTKADFSLVSSVPILAVSTNSLNFPATSSSLTVDISNEGEGSVEWEVVEAISWLTVNPVSGSTSKEGQDPVYFLWTEQI